MAGQDDSTSKAVRAGRIVDQFDKALRSGEMSLDAIPGLMRTILQEESWRERRIRTGRIARHERFIDFITSPPLDGLGERPEMIKRLLKDDVETLAAFEAAIVGPHGGNKSKSSNPTLDPDRGKAYTLRRLAKDHPELFEQVKAGELSANAAAITAGFRKVPTPLTILQKSWAKASKGERDKFLSWVQEQE